MTPFKSLRFFKHWSCKLQNFDMKTIIFMVIFIMTSVLKVSSTDIKSFEPVPKVVVFHLDHTLWPSWIENNMSPPFRKNQNGEILDFIGKRVIPYAGVLEVLEYLRSNKIPVAVISTSTPPKAVGHLVYLLNWNVYFTNKQIYSGPIINHLIWVTRTCKVHFKEMLYFDTELENYRDNLRLSRTGCVSIFLKKNEGVTMKDLMHGLETFSRLRNISTTEANLDITTKENQDSTTQEVSS